ncbi:uncharacterized protein LOC123894556 [Trifolium pratense]|uniref:uncharacterized protein LOC123894556 n=1 Tax=Trifolium pratense TaxID=57577 RepID=UPI001E693F2E|nr:uncharacterized protein LOC123894556 [Trifolium pratense]
MNQVIRGLNVRGSTMMQRSTMVDDVLILDSFVGNNIMSSSRSSTTRVNHPLMVNNHVPAPVMPPWSMLDHTIVFHSNSIANMGHHHQQQQNPNVTRVMNRGVNPRQNFQQLLIPIDDDEPKTTTGSSADSDSTCSICLTELSTVPRLPFGCLNTVVPIYFILIAFKSG